MAIGRIELIDNKKTYVPYENIGRIEIVDGKKQYVPYSDGNGGGCNGPVESTDTSLDDVYDLALEEGNQSLTLTWKDPDDVVFNGEALAEWAGTRVIRKEGSPPRGINDGILIADSKVKNQYAETGLQDNNTVLNVAYNYALFPYTTKNIYTFSDLNRVEGNLLKYNPILSQNTWQEIHEASVSGIAKKIWNIGDQKEGHKIIGFNHDDLADGTGKAGITFIGEKLFSGSWAALGNTASITYYDKSSIKTFFEGNPVLTNFSDELVSVMKNVNKKIATGDDYAVSGTKNLECKLWLPSRKEIFNTGYEEGELYEGAEDILNTVSTWLRTIAPGTYKTTVSYAVRGALGSQARGAAWDYKPCFCV